VTDQDDENRIAPAGFDVNGQETWNWTLHQSGQAAIAPGNLASVRRATAVNVIDVGQVMATPSEKYQDLWPR
jgi:hypothetical protein